MNHMIEKNVIGNAIEGESYVGKTSTIEAMKSVESIREKGIIVVPEYTVMGSLPAFPREDISDIKKSIQRIIDLEKRRTDNLVGNLAKNPGDLVVFDRGPISCIAFEYAAQKTGYKGAALWLAEAFQREVEDKNIIVPNGFIHFTADKKIIREREEIDLASGQGKVMDFLQDEDVIKALNEAFVTFGDFLPEQLFLTLDTGNKDPNQVGAEVFQFIKGQAEGVSNSMPDFIEYARSLVAHK